MIINPKKQNLEGYATIKDVEEVAAVANNASSIAATAQSTATAAQTSANEAKTTAEDKAPMYDYGTEDLVAGTTPLESGKLYFVYE